MTENHYLSYSAVKAEKDEATEEMPLGAALIMALPFVAFLAGAIYILFFREDPMLVKLEESRRRMEAEGVSE